MTNAEGGAPAGATVSPGAAPSQGVAISPGATVSAVVVNYKARDHLLACVASLEREGVGDVVVVDNGPEDGSQKALRRAHPSARWVSSGANLGYGRAANAGAAMTERPFLLVCNADVVVRPGAVATLVGHLSANAQVGLAAPRIVDADNRLYPSARVFPDLVDAFGHGLLGGVWKGNPYSRRYKMWDWDHAEARLVEWVSGSCFLARREAWETVGGFDRDYFMYMEDVDLCWRLGRAGWAVGYQPAAEVVHVQGVSTDQHPYRMLITHHASMWRFAWRTTPKHRRWLLPIVLGGLGARLLILLTAKALARANPEDRATLSVPSAGRATPDGAAG